MNYMPYYGLFSHDLPILDLQWRSPLCSLRALLLLCSMTHDITMGHDIITKLPESGDLCGNITEFGVAEGSLEPPGRR